MAGEGPANMIARRVTDDVISFSCETAPLKFMKFFLVEKVAESHSGECGSGQVTCNGAGAKPPATLAEFTIGETSSTSSQANRKAPSSTLEKVISLPDLTLNMVDLTLSTSDPKKTRPSVKVSRAYVNKKRTKKSPADPNSCSDKKAYSSTEQLLLTLIKDVKGYRNHLFDDCYSKPRCSTCGSTGHLTKEHLEHAAIKKTLSNLKAQSPLKLSPKKAPMIPKLFIECKYYGFNVHHSDHCEFYPGCEVCGSITHEASDCPKKHPNSRRPRIANRLICMWMLDVDVAYLLGVVFGDIFIGRLFTIVDWCSHLVDCMLYYAGSVEGCSTAHLQGDAVRDLENMKEITACDFVTLGDLEQLLARAQFEVDLKDGYLTYVEEMV
nr:thaumatin-like protein 1 [Tanacetum cinerariifolium]